jgi:hypothetical protein
MSEEIEETVPIRRGRPPKHVEEDVRSHDEAQVEYPEQIQMIRPFGFVQDNGQQLHWFQDMVVTDANDIKTIIDRGCKDWT